MFAATLLTLAIAAAPPRLHAEEVLRAQCLLYAGDPGNAWALAHGVKTFGPAYLATDGRRATQVIIHDFLQRNTATDGGAPFGFARYDSRRVPVEPHANLNLKALVADAKVPLKTSFKTSWGQQLTLTQLVDSAKAGFRHAPQVPEYWRDVGWTLSLFAATQQPGARWKVADGTVIELDKVFDDALTELEAQTAELNDGLTRQLPQVPKRKQGIYAHSCGGLHFVQGVLSWARHPAVRKKWGARLDAQLAIHFYRLESERAQYDAAFAQTQTMPQYRLPVLVQMVKFYGHWLEVLADARAQLGWKPTEAQQVAINKGKAYLDVAVRKLEAERAFENMAQLKEKQPQVYLDLIGDSCHAVHGLAAW